ncbi:hypothetical protein F2P56_033847 [Juglans regia]|uniref:Protein HAPLESS 2-like n=1 Tax=Juglans regia TaxID=51240 RepID=A0A833T8R4_JUGRE|nr:hypothetical protein F2P56_033847 [Juglans regia]
MGNIISSFFSGFGKVFGDLFNSPLDFLAGKSCSSECGSTWDFICYIENFCIANLLKIAMVLVLVYIVLLFFYLLEKVGLCQCIIHSLCKIVWACISSCFHAWEYCCIFLWVKLHKLKRVNRTHLEEEFDTSEEEYDDGSFSYHMSRSMDVNKSPSHRWRSHRGAYLRKCLRPRSHRIQVAIGRDSIHGGRGNAIKHWKNGTAIHDIRVTRTSKFAHKGRKYRRGAYHRSRL